MKNFRIETKVYQYKLFILREKYRVLNVDDLNSGDVIAAPYLQGYYRKYLATDIDLVLNVDDLNSGNVIAAPYQQGYYTKYLATDIDLVLFYL